MQKGTVGNFFVFGVLALLAVLAFIAVGGLPPDSYPNSGQVVNAVSPTTAPSQSTLQLETFGYVTIAPTPTPGSSETLCQQGGVNDEPSILDGYSPGAGQTVSQTGTIKVWVSDESAPIIAPGQQINTSTGAVVVGTGTLTAKAPDNYLWEPALYIAPHTAESGGTPYFPDFIKGVVNNNPPTRSQGGINSIAPDPFPAGVTDADPTFNSFTSEYIWDVSKLGLASGSYQAEFLIHDGDINRGVGCVSIQIQ